MTTQQRTEHRELYLQLRLNLSFPGESFAGEYRKPYNAVNKDDWTFDYMLTQPDTPDIAYMLPRHAFGTLATVGMR